MPALVVTEDELNVIVDALDSHIYWQLSDVQYRASGDVMEPGAEDPEKQQAIREASALRDRLQAAAS